MAAPQSLRIHACDWIRQAAASDGVQWSRELWMQKGLGVYWRDELRCELVLSFPQDLDFYEMFSGCGTLYSEFRQGPSLPLYFSLTSTL